MSAAVPGNIGEAAILNRLIRPDNANLSPEAARSILKLDFNDQDRARMHELADKSQAGTLSSAEEAELESYCRVGRLLDVLRSKARRSLKETSPGV
jgi:hypothetical protein